MIVCSLVEITYSVHICALKQHLEVIRHQINVAGITCLLQSFGVVGLDLLGAPVMADNILMLILIMIRYSTVTALLKFQNLTDYQGQSTENKGEYTVIVY